MLKLIGKRNRHETNRTRSGLSRIRFIRIYSRAMGDFRTCSANAESRPLILFLALKL